LPVHTLCTNARERGKLRDCSLVPSHLDKVNFRFLLKLGISKCFEKTMDKWFEKEQLHFAVQHNDLVRVKELVESGVNPNTFDGIGKTPLHYACKNEYFTIAEYLIGHGADVNAHHEASVGNTPLADIAGSCSFEMAKLLLRHGADPGIRGWMQLNAIDRAKQRKRAEGKRVYELLLSVMVRI
jgi:hypothetical protein